VQIEGLDTLIAKRGKARSVPSKSRAQSSRTVQSIRPTSAALTNDAAFREAIGEASIDYVLIDDYDTGSVALCRLRGSELEWLIPRPSQP
jgi:hypothetical protein